jgi:branched-chain amino acid transport system ATP-binding protein
VSVFACLTALENLLVFLQQHQEEQLLARLLRTPRLRRLEAQAVERARALLDLVGLGARADAPAGSLSYGQRKLLAFAAALMPDSACPRWGRRAPVRSPVRPAMAAEGSAPQ